MAKVRILAGDIAPGDYSLTTLFGTAIMVMGFGQALDLIQLRARFSLLDAQNFKTVMGTAGLATAGALLAGPLGAVGGMLLSGRKNICTFQCVLGDGRTFLGETDGKTWKKLLTVNFRTETAPKSPPIVDFTPSHPELPSLPSSGGTTGPEAPAPLGIVMAEDSKGRRAGAAPLQAVTKSERTPEESRVALKNMAWSVAGLMLVLGVLAYTNKVSVFDKLKRDSAAVQYVDEQGNPISKERAEAWLKQREQAHRFFTGTGSSAPTSSRETTIDTGSKGRRGVPGNLDCQYYAEYDDASELRGGTHRGNSIARYIQRMKTYCPEGVTIVYPDSSTEFLSP